MDEAERRPSKTPLRKQPEIEDMEEEGRSHSENVSMNSTAIDSRVNNNGKEDIASSDDGIAYNQPATTNGAAVTSVDNTEVTSDTQPMRAADMSPSPEATRRERTLKVNHSFSKAKPLMRGTAIDDSAPIPTPEVKVITTGPDNDDGPFEYTSHVPKPLLGQDGSMSRSVLQKNGSISSDAGTSNCSLSRESSVDKVYKDSSGVDLEDFIKKTLAKSKKDKQMLLTLEKDFKMFVNSDDQHYQLGEMCSYDRMICHRVAAFYGMDHNIDKSGKCVIISKSRYTRIPAFSCEEYVRTGDLDEASSERKQMRLLKKPASMEERSRGGDKNQFSSHRTKSLEERQKHYDEKRKIIFGASSEEAHGGSVIDIVPNSGGCKRLSSREWSSTDSSGYVSEEGSRMRRNMMAKSNSYGDSITSGSYESAPVRTKQASPENSQSPISGSGRSSADVNSPSQVQPHTNADGTPYRYNPNDPNGVPPWLVGSGASANPTQQPPGTANMSFNPTPSIQHVQYTQNSDLCNRFSAMEVATPMETPLEGQQQMLALGHHPPQPQHQPQQVPQPHLQQQTSQLPLMVSTAMQPAPQFVSSYPAGAAQGQGFYAGAQVQFVPVEAQGQCLPMAGPSGGSIQSGMVSYGQPHVIQTASTLQPTMLDQSSIPPGGLYGQNVYTGTVTDTGANPNGYCMPYMSNSVVYSSTHYPPNGVSGVAMTPTGAAHYGPYNGAQQSSSPQLAFAPMQNAQVRPATPPNLPIGQPVGYHNQQAPGMGLGHGVSSPPQFQHGTYYTTQPHPFSNQGQPMGQVMQVSVRPQGAGGGGGVPVSSGHPHPQPLQGSHQHQGLHNAPSLQHSQSFPLLRTVPSTGPTPLALGPAPNPAPTPPQHPMMSVKSMSMSSMRGGGGAATPDKETAGMGLSGTTAFLPGINQATAMQFPGQLVAQGMRQAQPGDLRVMGAAPVRPQMGPSLIAFQTGQPVRSGRPSGPRQSRPPKRNNSNAGSSNSATTTASASVARVMSLDTASALHQNINRQ